MRWYGITWVRAEASLGANPGEMKNRFNSCGRMVPGIERCEEDALNVGEEIPQNCHVILFGYQNCVTSLLDGTLGDALDSLVRDTSSQTITAILSEAPALFEAPLDGFVTAPEVVATIQEVVAESCTPKLLRLFNNTCLTDIAQALLRPKTPIRIPRAPPRLRDRSGPHDYLSDNLGGGTEGGTTSIAEQLTSTVEFVSPIDSPRKDSIQAEMYPMPELAAEPGEAQADSKIQDSGVPAWVGADEEPEVVQLSSLSAPGQTARAEQNEPRKPAIGKKRRVITRADVLRYLSVMDGPMRRKRLENAIVRKALVHFRIRVLDESGRPYGSLLARETWRITGGKMVRGP